MLVSLEIKNFLLIKKISINFIDGFNAFTGETGAGKSIIIEGVPNCYFKILDNIEQVLPLPFVPAI